MTRIHAFFVSFKKMTWPKQQLTSAWKVFIMIQKVEGADRLYRDAFLGIATSRTNQYHGYYCRKYFDIL